jgi:hypothetical protein
MLRYPIVRVFCVLVLFTFLLSCKVDKGSVEEVEVESSSSIFGVYQIVSFEEGEMLNYCDWIISKIGDVDVYFIINERYVVDHVFERELCGVGNKIVCSWTFFDDKYVVSEGYIFGFPFNWSGGKFKVTRIEKENGLDFWFRSAYNSINDEDWPKITLWKAKRIELI